MTTLNKYAIGILLAGLVIVGCATGGKRVPQTTADFAKTSATVTLEGGRSGGSGVILRSTANQSWILTNKHVCQLIQNGGVVTTDQGTYSIHSFQFYKNHDLCLVSVMVNLHVNTQIAEKPPVVYNQVIIAGHPNLLPTMVTRGHFTNRMQIQLMVDIQDCDGHETDEAAMFCANFGKKPVIRDFDSLPTTALIMPGSSGSGAFNSKGEIVGLAFAGSEGLSYGFIVPYEYLSDFVHNLNKYPVQYPDKDAPKKSLWVEMKKMEKYCRANKDKCHTASDSGIQYE